MNTHKSALSGDAKEAHKEIMLFAKDCKAWDSLNHLPDKSAAIVSLIRIYFSL